MTRAQVREALEASRGLAAKEYYFTGGEPFMNREIEGILEDALACGPATVLTNATLLPPRRTRALAALAQNSPYTLELRVSLDGFSPETNDPIRGEGTFDRCLEGIRELVAVGFLPIVTCMQSWPDAETEETLRQFRAVLASVGYGRSRLKILPPLRIGEEANRTRGYDATEYVSHEMLQGYDLSQLLCSRSRLVTARGVYACPILLESPSARLGDTLEDAVDRRAPLGESACFTCYVSGAICSNTTPSQGRDR
jgi:molybdenum cofactor biosynthesis enzyme MoaA